MEIGDGEGGDEEEGVPRASQQFPSHLVMGEMVHLVSDAECLRCRTNFWGCWRKEQPPLLGQYPWSEELSLQALGGAGTGAGFCQSYLPVTTKRRPVRSRSGFVVGFHW